MGGKRQATPGALVNRRVTGNPQSLRREGSPYAQKGISHVGDSPGVAEGACYDAATEILHKGARGVSRQDEVLVTRDGPVMTLTFNRPEAHNALTWNMYDRLYEACEEADRDDSVRVLVLRGAGGKAFVAGTDIGQFQAFEGAEDGIAYERDGDRRMARLEAVRKPVIAQVQGFAVGGGFRITACCDLRIATPEARFGAPIARTLGNCLSMAAYARFVDMFGPSRVKELLFTARLLTAEEAHAAGYVQEIVPADRIEARVAALARQIADHAPITLWVTKESIRRLSASRTLPEDEDLIAASYTSADFREGVRAFLDKRPPRWTGR
jgi:enoyl-CoA hydratase/carnithine racemase